jgi:secreted protein with Ig-like and vWFA domain
VLLQKARGEGESQDFGTVAGKEGGQGLGLPSDFSKATVGSGASAGEGQNRPGLSARRLVDAENLDKLSEEARERQPRLSTPQLHPAGESTATPHRADRAARAKDLPVVKGFTILPMQEAAGREPANSPTEPANAPVVQSVAEPLAQQTEQQLQSLAREQLERLAGVRLQVEQHAAEAAPVQLEALIEQQQPSVTFLFRQPSGSMLSLSERETSEAKYTEYFARLHAGIDDQTAGGERYARIAEQDFAATLETPLWTLATDVDTASYSNVRRFLDDGQWPPADAVRIEELVNYFPYEYSPPGEEHPVTIAVETAACPWQPQHRLARVALKAREIDETRRPPTSLVFLVDVSGSMNEANKLPLVQQSLGLLVDQLTENDRIGLVTYANEARTVFGGVSGERRPEIRSAVDALTAAGSTNGAGGLTLAYSVARECFLKEGNNRVILCSDGDFNVGISDDDELVRLIETERQSGVFLSIFGFGTGNLKDAKLEAIADHGNGQYAYIDSLDEARKALVEELWGTLYTVAKDVKLQIDFNPLQVESYRVVGYENRTLAAEDFDNDAVDAGDLGSGHTMTALVEYVPRAVAGPEQSPQLSEAVNQRTVRFGALDDGLVEVRRQGDAVTIEGEVYSEGRKAEFDKSVQALFGNSARRRMRVENRLKVVDRPAVDGGRVPFNDTLTVRLRYKQPDGQESTRLDVSLVDAGQTAAPSDDFQWATAVAAFGMLLRQSEYQGLANFEAVLETAQAAKGNDPTGRRREFIDLVRRARALWSSGHGIELAQPEPLPSTEAYAQASVAGKYDQLLEKVSAPDDFRNYGSFHDYGRWEGTDYLGRTGLPQGYWVYVYPDWFIWGAEHRDAASEAHPASPVP